MASIIDEYVYDVFLSFRGEDTRYGFTGNLKKALVDKGVRTFMDDVELQKGDEITPSLLNAIESSKIAIVVLSKNYAASSFCLQELSKILDSMKVKCVLPVFYKVEPSDVRKLEKTYGEAIAKHKVSSNPNTDKWKASLHQVADLSGFHYKKGVMKPILESLNHLVMDSIPDGAYGEIFVGRGQPLKWISVTVRGLISAITCGGYLWFKKEKRVMKPKENGLHRNEMRGRYPQTLLRIK
ncbi:resistance protein [Trifolium pratense]|uniref:Resistance protein n=1 Tax=Trifolium pratense TaxID=57577 RepID=A0A2K3N550_TRIPR|nr:resistance protein [Trifolium pratense]